MQTAATAFMMLKNHFLLKSRARGEIEKGFKSTWTLNILSLSLRRARFRSRLGLSLWIENNRRQLRCAAINCRFSIRLLSINDRLNPFDDPLHISLSFTRRFTYDKRQKLMADSSQSIIIGGATEKGQPRRNWCEARAFLQLISELLNCSPLMFLLSAAGRRWINIDCRGLY